MTDHLSTLVRTELIDLDLRSADKWQALEALVDRAVAVGALARADRDSVLAAVIARERSVSTGLESGLAVPHGFSPSIAARFAVIGRHDVGLPFDCLDGLPARFIVLLLAPDTPPARESHLGALAEIATIWAEAGHRNRLLGATTSGEVAEALRVSAR